MKDELKTSERLRAAFTENAEQFDALMVEMLAENERLSTALQETRAESHDAMNKAQAMVGNLEQHLHDTEARLQVADATIMGMHTAISAAEKAKEEAEARLQVAVEALEKVKQHISSPTRHIAVETLAKIKAMEGSDE